LSFFSFVVVSLSFSKSYVDDNWFAFGHSHGRLVLFFSLVHISVVDHKGWSSVALLPATLRGTERTKTADLPLFVPNDHATTNYSGSTPLLSSISALAVGDSLLPRSSARSYMSPSSSAAVAKSRITTLTFLLDAGSVESALDD